MIGAVAKLLGLDSLAAYAIVAALALAAATGAYWYVDHRGYERAAAEYTAILNAEHAALAEADANEQRRQTIANNAAKKREADALAKIEQQESDNLELRRKLASEAKQDPDAGRPAVGSSGVQRINKVR
jgi:sRNA-binding protein